MRKPEIAGRFGLMLAIASADCSVSYFDGLKVVVCPNTGPDGPPEAGHWDFLVAVEDPALRTINTYEWCSCCGWREI